MHASSNVILFPPAPIRPIPSPAATAAVAMAFGDEGAASVADVLLAMEAAPLAQPRLWLSRGMDRAHRVCIAVGSVSAIWSPAEARLAARALLDDAGSPGAAGVAARLLALASSAAAADAPLDRSPDPAEAPGGVTGKGFVIGMALMAMVAGGAGLLGQLL